MDGLARLAPPQPTPISPLLLSDRLLTLAELADQVGCAATARHLLRLASTVLDERKRPFIGRESR
jgi:hypothetical protein